MEQESRGGVLVVDDDPHTRESLGDLLMPRMNGWVFRSEQRRDPLLAGIPTVMVSGKERPQSAAGYLEAAGFIQKPVDPIILMSLLHRHCVSRSAHATRQPAV